MQAEAALQSVPTPELVIVQTIDNDIRCDGSDATNLPAFGDALKQTLDLINRQSPATTILVVGQMGRPSPAFVAGVVARAPSLKPSLTGSGICDFYDQAGKLNEAGFATLTKIIDGYEDEQARVGAAAAHCHTDGGVRAAYVYRAEYFTADWNHFNIAGLANEARLMWPVVANLLGVR